MVRSLRLSQACERVGLQCFSHVKRVLTDTGGVWRAERHCQWRLTCLGGMRAFSVSLSS